MQFDPVLLSRIQFAWVIAWHILLPAFTVGCASFIAVLEGLNLATGRKVVREARTMMSMALWALTVLVPLQMLIGDMHGLNTRKYQPAKLAAIEAKWDTGKGVPLTLFAIPDDKAEQNKFAIEIPSLGSMILTHDLHGEVKGLKDFPADQRPPVAIPFFAFRAMVGCAGLMLGLVLLGGWLRWRGQLYETRLYLLACQCAIPLGFIAVIAGWFVTEVGRQPWTVYGLLRTAASVSPSLASHDVTLSLLAYMAAYLLIYPSGVILLIRLVRKGPVEAGGSAAAIEAGMSAAPVLASQSTS
jgi:cytochrome d ubiquinol oxidase subunit I